MSTKHTLGSLALIAGRKSAELSSPRSKRPMIDCLLQNRMVKQINAALLCVPLGLSIAYIDANFIADSQHGLEAISSLSVNAQAIPATHLYSGMMFQPASFEPLECQSEDLSNGEM